jgi:tRNA1Val (adenine37-N6)-methyltransferase
MKVCTDACLFGAWIADKFAQKTLAANKIMDIGSGTGLLSLMLAQKTDTLIDGIEIDAEAYLQATENIEASPYKNQIHIFHGPVEMFAAHSKYDFIICNPPFYENQLQSDDKARNVAMHESTLTLTTLCNTLKNNLSDIGNVAILLPYDRVSIFEKILTTNNLFIAEMMHVKHSPTHPFFRTMMLISNNAKDTIENDISIKDVSNTYDGFFISLLKDYYLHL